MRNNKVTFDQPIQITPMPPSYTSTESPLTAYTIIPFATGIESVAIGTNSSGGGYSIIVAAIAASSTSNYNITGGTVPPTGGIFSLPYSEATPFVMPYTATLREIKFAVTNLDWTPSFTVHPYVAVAISNTNDGRFSILPETQTISSRPYLRNTLMGDMTVLTGEVTGLSTEISAGTEVAIICTALQTDSTIGTNYNFYYSGTLLLS